jgi:hypothetical protein
MEGDHRDEESTGPRLRGVDHDIVWDVVTADLSEMINAL